MTGTVVQAGPGAAVVAAVLLSVVALAGACVDGALAARAAGRTPASGLLAPVAETARLLRQRRRFTLAADVLLWRIGVAGVPVVALLMVAVLPLGRWTVADLPVGVVWFNAMDVLVWALAWLAGWGPNSAHPLLGGYRFLAQALAYELPLMFALTAPAVAAGSLRVADVVTAQQEVWFVFWMPLAFAVFCAGVLAFSLWGPFTAATGADLAGGILAELSGVDRLMLLAGRYALLAAGSAFAVALFFGGGAGPVLPDWTWFLLKTLLLLTVLVALRRWLPAVRPDRLVEAAWMIGLPATLLQILLVCLIVLGN